MGKKVYLIMLFAAVSIILSGCTAGQEHTENEYIEEKYTEKDSLSDTDIDADDTSTAGGQADIVGIWAHIRELQGDRMEIRSDTDGLPGDFIVTGVQDLPDADDLREGMKIQILMEAQGESYLAKEAIPLEEDGEPADGDVLLTEAPVAALIDVASSLYDPFEVAPGSYEWNVEKDGQMESVIACGLTPLEAAERAIDKKLRLRQQPTRYIFSTGAVPDILRIRQWDASDIGRTDVMEERVTAYYYKMPLLELEAGKVYVFEAEWKEEGFAEKRFYGTADYVLETE